MRRSPVHPRHLLVALALAFLVSACATLPFGGRKDSRNGVGWKQVMEKIAPSYLIAVDRTECTVTAERFAEVAPGDNVFCVWRVQGLAGQGFQESNGRQHVQKHSSTVQLRAIRD